ncbi:MAG: 23S rRNA (adenine(2503)-C(2))-methyltransferase RlmN [Acidimicrobiales bacterium]
MLRPADVTQADLLQPGNPQPGNAQREVLQPEALGSDLSRPDPSRPDLPQRKAAPLDLGLADLAALMPGEPPFRARQVRAGLLAGRSPREMSELPAALRQYLADVLPPTARVGRVGHGDGGLTTKWLWSLADSTEVETVLMRSARRDTVCVSTQAGCAMGCGFCATGQMGFIRHLSAGEILGQVVASRRGADPKGMNVVFMGMGEPLANYDATMEAVRTLHAEMGVSARRITVSTVGLVPGIRRLAEQDLPVTLAVSLHAADDSLRDTMIPINRRYPLASLMEACHTYQEQGGRRITFEWTLIQGVNDHPEQARMLARLLAGLTAHVNVIPLNPTDGYAGRAPGLAAAERFRQRLADSGLAVTVRRNRGQDISAACGQLATLAARSGGRPAGGPSA